VLLVTKGMLVCDKRHKRELWNIPSKKYKHHNFFLPDWG
jgi:hypothetical protein